MKIRTALGAGALAAMMALSMTACGAASTNPYANGGQYYAGSGGRVGTGTANTGRAAGMNNANTSKYNTTGNNNVGSCDNSNHNIGGTTAGNGAVNMGRAAGNDLRRAADNIVDGVTERPNTNLDLGTNNTGSNTNMNGAVTTPLNQNGARNNNLTGGVR